MFARNAFAVSMLLVVGGTPSALAEGSHDQNGESACLPTLYCRPYTQMACTNWTDQFGNQMCKVTSDVYFDQAWPFITMTKLTVPGGHYLVTGKTSFHPDTSGIAWRWIECRISQTGVNDWVDIASVNIPPGSAISIQGAVSSKTPIEVVLGCRLYGAMYDGTPITNFIVWGANLAAIEVRAVKDGR
jgi:hypothetical protein